jgi:hypothetical protein
VPLNAQNLSILEHTIARTAAPGPFALPPAARSMLTASQGLNDALDSLIISGRLLMSRYALTGGSVRYINERAMVQCGTDTVAAGFTGSYGSGTGPTERKGVDQLQVPSFFPCAALMDGHNRRCCLQLLVTVHMGVHGNVTNACRRER